MDVDGGQQRLEQLRESELLQGCRIFTTDKYVDGDEGGIEDLIGWPTYFGLVNLSYKLPRKIRLPVVSPAEAEDEAGQPTRLLQQVDEHFAVCRPDVEIFDRHRPAEFLAENAKKCARKLPNLNEALDRFERLFADINAGQEPKTPGAAPGQPHRITDLDPRRKASLLTETEKV
jgi:hypothetical protein